ncbi:MAG: hypothetical protein KC483_03615 [Nitrosarchaeum sp.]|nr:hypothetical protein [Nitrosarchaeum sp.]
MTHHKQLLDFEIGLYKMGGSIVQCDNSIIGTKNNHQERLHLEVRYA